MHAPAGALALAALLRRSHSLAELDVGKNSITAEVGQKPANLMQISI